MNYAVHSVMYGYYFLMAIRHKPNWFKPFVITLAQISQMVVGIAVTAVSFYCYKQDPDCYVRIENIGSALIMYGSYLLLFVEFFLGHYYGKPTGIASTKKEKEA
jgi:hypothetical protein